MLDYLRITVIRDDVTYLHMYVCMYVCMYVLIHFLSDNRVSPKLGRSILFLAFFTKNLTRSHYCLRHPFRYCTVVPVRYPTFLIAKISGYSKFRDTLFEIMINYFNYVS